jgi:hypothetical protein
MFYRVFAEVSQIFLEVEHRVPHQLKIVKLKIINQHQMAMHHQVQSMML